MVVETIIVYSACLSIFSFFSSFFISHIITTHILRNHTNHNYYYNINEITNNNINDEITNSDKKKIKFNQKVKCIMIPSCDDTKIKELWYTNEEYEVFRLHVLND